MSGKKKPRQSRVAPETSDEDPTPIGFRLDDDDWWALRANAVKRVQKQLEQVERQRVERNYDLFVCEVEDLTVAVGELEKRL